MKYAVPAVLVRWEPGHAVLLTDEETVHRHFRGWLDELPNDLVPGERFTYETDYPIAWEPRVLRSNS